MDPTEAPAEMNTHAPTLTPGQERVWNERQRQINGEGWNSENDDCHVSGELCQAATAYLTGQESVWPVNWSKDWWKPAAPKRNLEKAGALYLAEGERLRRHVSRLPAEWKGSEYAQGIELAADEAFGLADLCGHLLDLAAQCKYAPQIIL